MGEGPQKRGCRGEALAGELRKEPRMMVWRAGRKASEKEDADICAKWAKESSLMRLHRA